MDAQPPPQVTPGPPAEPRARRPLWLRTLIGLGWTAWILMGSALWLPSNGRLERFVERTLQSQLGAADGNVEVSAITLDWTARSMTIGRVAYVAQREEFALQDLELRLGWSLTRGPFLEQAVALHGYMRVSEPLIRGIQATLGDAPTAPTPLDLTLIPALAIEDLKLEIETPEWGDMPLGVVRASLRKDSSGRPYLVGRMAPALEGDQGELLLEGSMETDGRLVFRSTARDLPLGSGFLPELPAFDWVRALYPQGRADLDADGHWAFGREALPHLDIRAVLRDGEVRLPWLANRPAHTLVDLGAVCSASFAPDREPSLWNRDAWRGRADLSARWKDTQIDGQVRFAGASTTDALAELFAHVEDAHLDEDLVELLGSAEWVEDLWESLALGGKLEAYVGLRTPTDWDPTRPETLERAVALVADGNASCAYVGGLNEDGSGERNYGFPLAITGVEGLVTHLVGPHLALPERLSLVGLKGRHSSGPVRANGSSHLVPLRMATASQEGEHQPRQFDLSIHASDLAVDDDLRAALGGLSGLDGCERLAEEFQPDGGRFDLKLELLKQTGQEKLSAGILVDVQEVDLTPEVIGIGLQATQGSLAILIDGRSDGGSVVSVDLHGDLAGCEDGVRVLGRSQNAPENSMVWWKVAASGVDLNGPLLRESLGRQSPDDLDALGLVGHVDLELHSVQASDSQTRAWLEIHSGEEPLRAEPPDLHGVVEAVAGRASLDLRWPAVGGPAGSDALASAQVAWRVAAFGQVPLTSSRVPLYVSAGGRPALPAQVVVSGAGLDLEASQVRESLALFMGPSPEGTAPSALAELEQAGTLDFSARLALPPPSGPEATDPSAPTLQLSVSTHLKRIGPPDAPILERVEGGGEYKGEVWTFDYLTAELAGSPVELSKVLLKPGSVGTWLKAQLSAQSLPIDEQHLQHFLDAQTLESLLGELGCSGEIQLDNTQLELTHQDDATIGMHLKGPVTLRDVTVRLGLPVVLHRAEDIALDLFYENGRVRAAAQVRDLDGEVAGRKLNETDLQVTYIEPRLTIEALDGRFEGGRLRSIALPGSARSGFFSLDLAEPYAFSLAGEMKDVEVSELLRGVFNSDFANRGKINADIQLRGRLSNLNGIRGAGRFRLTDSGLWAIPVFQVLFSQLGFESAAIFSRFDARFTVNQGKIDMNHIRLKSDLLSLVGKGTLDMKGNLDHSLEVNYSLLDRLGPITRVLYFIQSSLLRINVLGNLDRPEVAVKGLFSQFFSPAAEGQKLPLPPYSKRPRRF
ncbi:MAG: AsmA-like C-terminal region-containing protein [bacterium]